MGLGGMGTGAAAGALYGSLVPGIGTVTGALAGGLIGSLFGKKKKSGNQLPTYTPTPYGGYRPPQIDSPGQEILRPTQKQDFELTMKRSRGEDVGYDPSWMSSAVALTKNELDRAREDNLREQKGAISAAGLSGNPRAYEATAGRINRNYSTDLENSLNRLNVTNMEASRADKNSATERLATLNRNNFGQENSVADFDRAVWAQEEANKRGAAGLDATNYWKGLEYDTGEGEKSAQGMTGFATDALQTFSPSVQALLRPAGTGIAPTGFANFDPNMSTSGGGYRQTGPFRKITR